MYTRIPDALAWPTDDSEASTVSSNCGLTSASVENTASPTYHQAHCHGCIATANVEHDAKALGLPSHGEVVMKTGRQQDKPENVCRAMESWV